MSVLIVDEHKVGNVAAFVAYTMCNSIARQRLPAVRRVAEPLARILAKQNIESFNARYPEKSRTKSEENSHAKRCAQATQDFLAILVSSQPIDSFRPKGDQYLTFGDLEVLAGDIESLEYNCANAPRWRESQWALYLLEARRPLLRMVYRSSKREALA